MFADSVFGLVGGMVFTTVLLIACVADLRTRRIPNGLVGVLGAAGLVYSAASGPLGQGLMHGIGGLGVGLLIWIPFYLLRLLGAGDVKLFAAAGAWLGPAATLEAALLAGIVGGVMAAAWLIWRQGLRQTAFIPLWFVAMRRARAMPHGSLAGTRYPLPYGVALAAGAAVVAWFPSLILS